MSRNETIYLTSEGLKRLKKEYKELKETKKKKTKEGAPEALHSEEINAEFISFREDIEKMESRIRELEQVLRNYKLIKKPPRNERDEVKIGAYVTVEVEGEEDEFRLVGTMEANPSAGRISNASPAGKVLLGKKEGEKAKINSPVQVIYKIKNIKY